MKTFNITFILLTFIFTLNAQDIASVNPSSFLDSSHSSKTAAVSKIQKEKHNTLAKTQLYTYLSKNLTYSSFLRDNGLEGQITLEVSISNKGIISDYKVIKSNNKAFDKIVLNIMRDLDKLNISDNTYFGSKKILVPINFSL